MAIYSGFSHWKWWFSIVMLVYQRVVHEDWSWQADRTQPGLPKIWHTAAALLIEIMHYNSIPPKTKQMLTLLESFGVDSGWLYDYDGFYLLSCEAFRPQASITPTLMTVIGMGLKDPFSPCRCAALQTSEAENGHGLPMVWFQHVPTCVRKRTENWIRAS